MNLNLLYRIITSSENLEQVVSAICRETNVQTTDRWLATYLQNHPDYPSLSSLSDCFRKLGFSTQAFLLNSKENAKRIGSLHIAQIKEENGEELLAVIYRHENDIVYWVNPKTNNKESITWHEFKEKITGYIMLLSEATQKQEPDYWRHLSADIFQSTLFAVAVLSPVLLAILASFHLKVPLSSMALFSAGYALGLLLMLQDINAYAPVVQKICGKGRKFNCAAVLSSKGSKFLGVSWAVWGSSYFLAGLLSMTIYTPSLVLWSWMHLLVLPYIAYSLYYQRFVVRQWCPLCIGVLCCIAGIPLSSYLEGVYNTTLWSKDLFASTSSIFISGLLSFVIFYLIKEWGTVWRGEQWLHKSYNRLRLSSKVFGAMLNQERSIHSHYKGMGVTIGNPNGKIQILEICNPFCEPCADAQKELHSLLEENEEIGLQILFLYPVEWCERSPIPLFLSLKDDERLPNIISSWFKSEDKDVEVFQNKHPYELNLEEAQGELQAMLEFCESEEINSTPTIFVNGHKLPSSYSVADLHYCL